MIGENSEQQIDKMNRRVVPLYAQAKHQEALKHKAHVRLWTPPRRSRRDMRPSYWRNES
jgi:hypothetical protein